MRCLFLDNYIPKFDNMFVYKSMSAAPCFERETKEKNVGKKVDGPLYISLMRNLLYMMPKRLDIVISPFSPIIAFSIHA